MYKVIDVQISGIENCHRRMADRNSQERPETMLYPIETRPLFRDSN